MKSKTKKRARKSAIITLRVEHARKTAYSRAASRKQLGLSAWMLDACDKEILVRTFKETP